MKTWSNRALLLLGLFAAGCGSDDDGGTNPDGEGNGDNAMSATIDGDAWSADADFIFVTGNATATHAGMLVISGTDVSTGISVGLNLSFIVGPATQPLGVNPASNPGGTGSVTDAPDLWLTPFNGAAGFITITARTDKRIAGTFNFTAAANLGAGPGTISVTAGSFDITIEAGLPPLPAGVGSTAIATIGGTPWNAATIVGIQPGAGQFSLAADNTTYSISIVPKLVVSAGNTYGVPSQIGITVSRTGTADAWWGGLGTDIGTMTISTLNSNRLIATFSGTLPPLKGAASLAVTGGAINVYLASAAPGSSAQR